MTSFVLVALTLFTCVLLLEISDASNDLTQRESLRSYGSSGRARSSSRGSMQRSSSRYRGRSSRGKGGGGGGGGGGYVFIPDSNSNGIDPKTMFLGLKVLILKIILLLTQKDGGNTDFTSLFSGMGGLDPSMLSGLMPGGGGTMNG